MKRAAALFALGVTVILVLGQRFARRVIGADGIAISNDGKFIFVCASDDDTIQIIDTATFEIVGTLPSGPDPELIALSSDGKRLYVANEDDNLVTVIDVDSRSAVSEIPVGVEPEWIGVSPDGKTVVATSETTNMAHFIDADTREITANVLVDSRPRFAEFKSDGSEVWVSSEIGGTVSVIEAKSHAVKKKIGFEIPGLAKEAIQAVGVSITKDGKKAFVALGPANRVAMINADTYEVEKYIISTNGVSNDVTFIEVATGEPVKSTTVGEMPWGAVVAPK